MNLLLAEVKDVIWVVVLVDYEFFDVQTLIHLGDLFLSLGILATFYG